MGSKKPKKAQTTSILSDADFLRAYIRSFADEAILQESEQPLQLTRADLPDAIYALNCARIFVRRMLKEGLYQEDSVNTPYTRLECLLGAVETELGLLATGKKSTALTPNKFAQSPRTSHPELWRMRLEALSYSSALRDYIPAEAADAKTVKLLKKYNQKCSQSALDDWRRELRRRLVPCEVFEQEPWLSQSRLFIAFKHSYRNAAGEWVSHDVPLAAAVLKRLQIKHVNDTGIPNELKVERLNVLATEIIAPIAARISLSRE